MLGNQTTAISIEHFARTPMDHKSVSEVPGVGPKLKEKFIRAGIEKSTQLYEQLLKLDFEEQKFRVWMRLNVSKKARISPVYQALRAWHGQFGARVQQTKEADREGTESPPAQTKGDKKRRHAVKKRRNSVLYYSPEYPSEPGPRVSSQADLSDSSTDGERLFNHAKSKSDHELMQYLASFSSVFRRIPEEFHTEFRRDILNLAEKYEKKRKLKENSIESQPSTSS